MGVSSSGILTSVARGKTLVIAADKKNTAHFDQAEVKFIFQHSKPDRSPPQKKKQSCRAMKI